MDQKPKEKCIHCKRAKEHHRARTLACPVGRKTRIGFTSFSTESVFTAGTARRRARREDIPVAPIELSEEHISPEIHEGMLSLQLDTAAEIRRELNDVHWVRFKRILKLASSLFGTSSKLLKFVCDLNYYKGGYPNKNSPPRIDEHVEKIVESVRYFHLIGRLEEITKPLNEAGIHLSVAQPKRLHTTFNQHLLVDPNVVKILKGLGITFRGKTPKTVFSTILDHCHDQQACICSRSNIIKKDIYGEVKATSAANLKKSGFMSAVRVRVKAQRLIEDSKPNTSTSAVNTSIEVQKQTLTAIKVAGAVKSNGVM